VFCSSRAAATGKVHVKRISSFFGHLITFVTHFVVFFRGRGRPVRCWRVCFLVVTPEKCATRSDISCMRAEASGFSVWRRIWLSRPNQLIHHSPRSRLMCRRADGCSLSYGRGSCDDQLHDLPHQPRHHPHSHHHHHQKQPSQLLTPMCSISTGSDWWSVPYVPDPFHCFLCFFESFWWLSGVFCDIRRASFPVLGIFFIALILKCRFILFSHFVTLVYVYNVHRMRYYTS